jgi:hypothetical protein
MQNVLNVILPGANEHPAILRPGVLERVEKLPEFLDLKYQKGRRNCPS